jgi:putative tricarboxylic transport membrane protein
LPKGILSSGILIISVVGAYLLRFNMLDVWTTLICGILGYSMRRYHSPQAPLILGMALGPLMESNFRNALLSSYRDFMIFFTRPISAAFLNNYCLFVHAAMRAGSVVKKTNVFIED